ncbi:oxidoreductase [Brachybacterium sp. YJGR34]|uniref:oxidoreductase n=1 Tax=Brachybacterium sp. YJGR34 TaxID=2059911 RepID=UPI000E0B2A62|nr:oxidoreductase [Brachybacterium sp. YJGR34]
MSTPLHIDLSRLAGRTVVVTGANSGLGLVTARALADAGAHVVLAVRTPATGEQAAASMPGTVEVRRLDLADLTSVRAFAEELEGPVDVLVNNAGLMVPPLGRTADGFELQMGTNHLGHFALTGLLLPRLRDRVVTLSSIGHRMGRIDLEDLNWRRRPYRAMPAYAQSKLANLLFTAELQRRLGAAGSPVRALAAHPGVSSTALFHRGQRPTLSARFAPLIAQPAEVGAQPTLAAAAADLPGDSYVGPGGLLEMRGAPALVSRSRRARDVETARRLWDVSEELTGVRFPLP